MSYGKRSCKGCFNKLGAQGSAIAVFIPLAAQSCIAQTMVFFFSMSGSGRGDLSVYNKGLRMGGLVC